MNISRGLAALSAIAILGLLQACGSTDEAVTADPLLVTTNSGQLRGIELENGVKAWLGVRFAQPPTQNLRWQPPQPIQWEGVYNADRKMSECMQVLRPHNINHYFGEEATSEDCLFMNIWAPADATPASGLPVIAFIYGGGGTIGSSGMPSYGGDVVAERGAIFVNFNYRVGLLGFLAHPELTAEQGGHSGNYAYLDQNAALRWIHDNIAEFGGDPNKVVLTGQSAGAGSVTQQIFSPLSQGLFAGAMLSSGCTWGGSNATLAAGEAIGLQVQEALGAANLKAMRDVPADRIIDIQQENQVGVSVQGFRASGVIDGYFMPASQMEILQAGGNSDVPVIAHYNAHESNTALTRATTVAEYENYAHQMYGAAADDFLALYPVTSDADVWAQSRAAATDGRLAASARNCAMLQAEYNESPVFISEFGRKHPYSADAQQYIADQNIETVGAYHTGDIPYWFGTQDVFNMFNITRDWTPYDREMSLAMTNALIALAETGSPATDQHPWPAWSADNQVRMYWGDTMEVRPLNTAGMEFLATHQAAPVELPPEPPRVGPRD